MEGQNPGICERNMKRGHRLAIEAESYVKSGPENFARNDSHWRSHSSWVFLVSFERVKTSGLAVIGRRGPKWSSHHRVGPAFVYPNLGFDSL